MDIVVRIVAVVAATYFWILAGRFAASKLGFTGEWATLKGQLLVIAPVAIPLWAMLIYAGAMK